MSEGLKKTAKGWTYNGKLLSPAEQRFHDKIAALTPEQRQEIAEIGAPQSEDDIKRRKRKK